MNEDLSYIAEDLRPLAVDVDSVHPDPANVRLHDEENLAAIRGSLARFGQRKPIVVNRSGHVIEAGNGTWKAARALGWPKIAAVFVEDDPTTATGYSIADNRTAELAAWDGEALAMVLSSWLTQDEGLLEGTGWSPDDVAGLMAEFVLLDEGPPDDPGRLIDEAAEWQEEWQVQRGQVWEIPSHNLPGRCHRLMCGDSTNEGDVAKLMAGEKAALGFTSPPYWVGKEYETQTSIEEIETFVAAVCRSFNRAVRKDASRVVVNTGTGFTTSFDRRKKRQVLLLIDKWANAFYDIGWNLRHVRHWIKEGQLKSTSPRTDLIDQHCEFLGTFEADEGAELDFDDLFGDDDVAILETFYNTGGTTRGQERTGRQWALRSYWDDIKGAAHQSGHCASFPVELVGRHVLLYTKRGEVVVDLCLGAGTTVVAAEYLMRVGYGMELEPKYCAVALQRLSELGLEPQLANDGIPHEERDTP